MDVTAALCVTRPDISVKIPPRASEIFHAFQVADAQNVGGRADGPAIKSGVCVSNLFPSDP